MCGKPSQDDLLLLPFKEKRGVSTPTPFVAFPINLIALRIVIILVLVDVVLLTACTLALNVARYQVRHLSNTVGSDVYTKYDDENQYDVSVHCRNIRRRCKTRYIPPLSSLCLHSFIFAREVLILRLSKFIAL